MRADVQSNGVSIQQIDGGTDHLELFPLNVHVDQIDPFNVTDDPGENEAFSFDRLPTAYELVHVKALVIV